MILTFILGAVIGATLGVALMACLTISQVEKFKEDDK